MDPQMIVFFYSKYSRYSMYISDMITQHNLLSIVKVCVDSKDVKNKILNDPLLKIDIVPTLLLIYSSGAVEKYIGEDIEEWISHKIPSFVTRTPEFDKIPSLRDTRDPRTSEIPSENQDPYIAQTLDRGTTQMPQAPSNDEPMSQAPISQGYSTQLSELEEQQPVESFRESKVKNLIEAARMMEKEREDLFPKQQKTKS